MCFFLFRINWKNKIQDEHGVTTQPRNSNNNVNRFSPNVNDFLNPTPQGNDPQQLMNR